MEGQTLPFSEDLQDALLGYILKDDGFFQQVRHLVLPDYFIREYSRRVYRAKIDYADRWKKLPTTDEIANSESFLAEENKVRTAIRAHISKCIAQTQSFALESLADQVANWIKSCKFKIAHTRSAEFYKQGRVDRANEEMTAATKEISQISFGADLDQPLDNPSGLVRTQMMERDNGLTFGINSMDRFLDPSAPNGALLRGDMTVLLAPSNSGKTKAMITTALANAMKGQRVLFMTHEGKPDDIRFDMYCSAFGKTRQELIAMESRQDGWRGLDREREMLRRFITYVPYNKPGMKVEDVVPIIQRYQENCIAKHGEGYDMLVSDYPAKLSCAAAGRGHMAKRNIDEEVYNYYVQLGIDCKFHVLTCIQTNREGSKINKGMSTDRLLQSEDVAESWGVITAASNVISINRDPAAAIAGRVSYHICKSRSNETAWTVVCRSDYARSRTHSNEMGSVFYRGAGTTYDQIDGFMAQTQNTDAAVPEHLVARAAL